MAALVQEYQRPIAGAEIDTVRALLHDLRQPLAAILLLAGAEGGDVRHKLEVIAGQARWLAELVETSLGGGAATDGVTRTDVAGIARDGVERAMATAGCEITLSVGTVSEAWARPVALARALSCVLDNAVRAAGAGGHVTVEVQGDADSVHLLVVDDGPGLGKVAARTSLGLSTTRAMVAACQGAFRIHPAEGGGTVADIRLDGADLRAVAS